MISSEIQERGDCLACMSATAGNSPLAIQYAVILSRLISITAMVSGSQK